MRRHAVILAWIWIAAPSTADAQDGPELERIAPRARKGPDRETAVSAALVYARAQGAFSRHVSEALGFTMSAHQLETSSNVLVLGVGPRVRTQWRPVEPYVSASVGAAFFFTSTMSRDRSVSPLGNGLSPDGRMEDSFDNVDATFPAATFGGGLRVPLSRGPNPIALNLGARYQGTPPVRYVTQADASGFFYNDSELTTAKSSTAMWLFHLGVSVHLGSAASPPYPRGAEPPAVPDPRRPPARGALPKP